MKRIIPASIVIFTSLIGNLANAQNSILIQKTYEGQIGNAQIVVEILHGQKNKIRALFLQITT